MMGRFSSPGRGCGGNRTRTNLHWWVVDASPIMSAVCPCRSSRGCDPHRRKTSHLGVRKILYSFPRALLIRHSCTDVCGCPNTTSFIACRLRRMPQSPAGWPHNLSRSWLVFPAFRPSPVANLGHTSPLNLFIPVHHTPRSSKLVTHEDAPAPKGTLHRHFQLSICLIFYSSLVCHCLVSSLDDSTMTFYCSSSPSLLSIVRPP